LFALEHTSVFARQADEIRSQRARLQQAFQSMPTVQSWPSDANMILLRITGPGDPAQRLFDALKHRGILVKNVSKMHPLLANCLRVTVGAASENDALLAALKDLL
jgi:histidinol-phosphate aminotransferase